RERDAAACPKGEPDKAASELQDFTRQAEPRGSVHHEAAEHPAQQEVSGLNSQERIYGGPAAAAAADARKAVQREAAEEGDSDTPKRVKCFVSGMRWGITLAPTAVQTRTLLAAALNEKLAAYVAPGRGDRLHVVFVDAEGRISEFPPTMEAGWRTAASSSCRVYVNAGLTAR
ncbi:hypothetical protein WJX81_000029, partial [Elliptochloris bilobata]